MSIQPLNILHLITGLNTGGAERMLVNLLEATDRERFLPVVVSLTDAGSQGPVIEALNVPLHTLGMRPGQPSLRAFLDLRRLIRQLQPDVIHGWMYHGALAALLARDGRPVVVGIHHSLHDEMREKSTTRLVIRALRWLAPRAARLAYCSAVSRAQHESFGYPAKNALVIPNGFDCDRFRPDLGTRARVRSALGLTPEAFVVGHLGRYHPMKDHANFLEAAARLVNQRPKARFVLAGTGVEAGNVELRSQVERLGLSGYVQFLSERRDVPELLNTFDVLSTSSAWGEAFPNVIGEAMACGVPCVATDVGDSAFIIGEAGMVVPPRDPQALADAWRALADMGRESRVHLGGAARTRILLQFSLKAIAGQYEQLYKQIGETSKESE